MTADRPTTEPTDEQLRSWGYDGPEGRAQYRRDEAAQGAAPRAECGRTDTVTTVDGRELLFRCDREGWDHPGRHHAVNVDGVELFWARSGAAPRAEGLDTRLRLAAERVIASFDWQDGPLPIITDSPLAFGNAVNRLRDALSRPSDERVPESEER